MFVFGVEGCWGSPDPLFELRFLVTQNLTSKHGRWTSLKSVAHYAEAPPLTLGIATTSAVAPRVVLKLARDASSCDA